jgi:hypothetical protein
MTRFAAVHESGFGTKQTWRDDVQFVRFRAKRTCAAASVLMARGAIDHLGPLGRQFAVLHNSPAAVLG